MAAAVPPPPPAPRLDHCSRLRRAVQRDSDRGSADASGNGQTFDFAALGSEYVGELDVHKTPDFTLSAGAVGATINVKSPHPFDHPGAAGARLRSRQPLSEGRGRTRRSAPCSATPSSTIRSASWSPGTIRANTILQPPLRHRGLERRHLVRVRSPAARPADPVTPTAVPPAAERRSELVPPGPGHVRRTYRSPHVRTDGWPCNGIPRTRCWSRSTTTSHPTRSPDRWQRSTWFGCFPSLPDVTQDANGTLTELH